MDALGFEETNYRVGEGTEFAATLTCVPDGDKETGSLWYGHIKFDNDSYNWGQVFPYGDPPLTITYPWKYPATKSGGTHLMNLLVGWHGEIVALFKRVRTSDAEVRQLEEWIAEDERDLKHAKDALFGIAFPDDDTNPAHFAAFVLDEIDSGKY